VFRDVLPERFSGLRVAYGRCSALGSTDAAPTPNGVPQVGEPNPYAPQLSERVSVSRGRPVGSGELIVLGFLARPEDASAWRELVTASQSMSGWLCHVAVLSPDAAREGTTRELLGAEEQDELRQALRARWGELIIQRPDGYLGYRGALASGAEALAYLSQLLGLPLPRSAAPRASLAPLPQPARAPQPKLGATR